MVEVGVLVKGTIQVPSRASLLNSHIDDVRHTLPYSVSCVSISLRLGKLPSPSTKTSIETCGSSNQTVKSGFRRGAGLREALDSGLDISTGSDIPPEPMSPEVTLVIYS